MSMTRTTPEDMTSSANRRGRPYRLAVAPHRLGGVDERIDPVNPPTEADTDRPPTAVRLAGALTAVEGVVALGYAIFLVIREAAGHHEVGISGYGTAAWFGIIFGGVLIGGVALLRGRRWGRAISMVAQILLLPVAYYAFTSHRPELAIPVGVMAVIILGALFAPASLRWLSGDLEIEEPAPAPPRGSSSRGSGSRGSSQRRRGRS